MQHLYGGKNVKCFTVYELTDGHKLWLFKCIERNRKLDTSSLDDVPVCQMGRLIATQTFDIHLQ